MADTAMERWEAYITGGAWGLGDAITRSESIECIRLALEAAPAGDLVGELKRRGVLEFAPVRVEMEGKVIVWDDRYRIRPDALGED